jgi:predicted O-linked N-acetylglucosamine transferase (SPINDLY family)
LPRERFEVSLFHLGALSDATTGRLKQDSRYYDCARLSQAALVETIAGAQLDVLIWPDLGMEAKAQIPAALRLAPVQANGGGHPITSGLAAMDYVLSSDLMEPAGAEAHYTERLVRLPNLASAYPRPVAGDGTAPALVQALKRAGRVLYLCSQSLYKLLPQDDRVFADIAKAVPAAEFLFISHPEPAVTEFFRQRMAAAFARAGADGRRVHCVPALTQQDFYALNREVDVILDSFAWSGNNSTLEALAFDRPVVTLPGAMMRARHTAAILTRLGIPELIARDRPDYVAIAARLGRDPAWRASVMARIAERSAALYDDPAPIAALAAWLEQVVRRQA